ncbi:unnamed protein product [Cuscuta epithymum]|uniref:DUF4408 domain-containing protein n=1 Tax=Cuscuta epithymum TaxID=186058 RepID=A0AAV0DTA5_9ASTE|nr:unnamed protein product [Cuscuta epithymum]
MDLHTLTNIKPQKEKVMQRLRKMQMITAAFRFIELCMFLVILWRFSCNLSINVLKLSGGYFRGLLISPGFVFLLGNAIFIVLFLGFLRSGDSSENHGSVDEKVDFYEEFTKKYGKSGDLSGNYCEEQIKKQGKQGTPVSKEKKMQRSQSEGTKKKVYYEEATRRELGRLGTITRRKSETAAPAATEEMSGEEFRRKVEDFIARQQRALREEEFSFLVSN